MTITTGSRSTKLSKGVLKQVKQVEQILADAKSITCTAYTDTGSSDTSLTKSQAKAACAALKKDGFKGSLKSAGKGDADPVASNSSSKGRTENRRIVFTFKL
jgi:OOP family OmpA-OmpF porin